MNITVSAFSNICSFKYKKGGMFRITWITKKGVTNTLNNKQFLLASFVYDSSIYVRNHIRDSKATRILLLKELSFVGKEIRDTRAIDMIKAHQLWYVQNLH